MAKIEKLSGGIVSVAAGQLGNVLRDVLKNDSILRVWGITHTLAPGNMVDDGDIIDASPGSDISMGYFAAAPTAAADITFTVVKQGNGGYKVSDAATSAVDTPEEMAALAYGDSARTTFPSLTEFARLALESAIQGAYAGQVDCIVIDQVNELVEGYTKNFDAGATGFTEVLVAEQDDSAGNQFGE